MADTLGNANSPTVEDDPLIQYVIVRKDLLEEPFSWPLGSVISQGVHAAVAAISAFDSKMYCAQRYGVCIDSVKVLGDDAKDEDAKPIPQFPLVQMRTVTLEVKDEKSLLQIASRLKENQVHFALWNEMPERIPTALATSPDHKSKIFPFVKKLRLFK